MSAMLVIFLAATGDGGGVTQIEMPDMAACTREADKIALSRHVRAVLCINRRRYAE
jgi:hypothetical protein